MNDNPDLEYMRHPTHQFTPDTVRALTEEQWLAVVAEMAFPERAPTMVKACELARERDLLWIAETGTIRGWAGDGQSTLILAALMARIQGVGVTSIDNNPVHAEHSRAWIGGLKNMAMWICDDSVRALHNFQSIDLLYLDSYDYDAANPLPCQIHQLAELGAAYGGLSDRAIILLDDAKLDGGGKVRLSAAFLKERGWTLLMDEYQQLWVR